jgi:hypothetical protein
METATRSQEIALTTKRQVGIMGLGVVGAHGLYYGGSLSADPGALCFKARLHFAGQTRVRIMQVVIKYNEGADLYDVWVIKPDGEAVAFAEGVYADQLTNTMYRLDSEGVPK